MTMMGGGVVDGIVACWIQGQGGRFRDDECRCIGKMGGIDMIGNLSTVDGL